jgi:hypothetical protein
VIWGLPPDVMHDLLEGVIPRLVCEVLLLSHRVKINNVRQAQNFNYAHTEIKDKPSVIKLENLTKKIVAIFVTELAAHC